MKWSKWKLVEDDLPCRECGTKHQIEHRDKGVGFLGLSWWRDYQYRCLSCGYEWGPNTFDDFSLY